MVLMTAVEITREDVHGQYVVRPRKAHGSCYYRLSGNGTQVGIGIYHIPIGLQGLLIPCSLRIIIVCIPIPGIGGNDFSINYRIGIHNVLSNDGSQLIKIAVQPLLDFVLPRPRGSQLLYILNPQLHEVSEGRNMHLLLRRIALGQRRSHDLDILQQLCLY